MRRLFAFAINRAEFLRGNEKQLLWDLVDSEEFFFSLTISDLSQVIGRSLRTQGWNPQRLLSAAARDMRVLDARGMGTILRSDPSYPWLLREIYDPPFLLYYRGTLPEADAPIVSMVGTRHPSRTGTLAADQLGREAAQNGATVVSGFALGIDTAAHYGCVSAGGPSVAVLGCGIDTIYPAVNKQLAARLLSSGGAFVSEYPPGSPPVRHHFPERNRIISGLSPALVVVEAPAHSGALITADYALEQGRDVFVHAGCTQGEYGAGTRALLEDGAIGISGFREVLWELGLPVKTDRGMVEEQDDYADEDVYRSAADVGTALAGRVAVELGLAGKY